MRQVWITYEQAGRFGSKEYARKHFPIEDRADEWIAARKEDTPGFKVLEYFTYQEDKDILGYWVVRYVWHRVSEIASPWYWYEDRLSFYTHEAAKAWARSPHPEYPGYDTLRIVFETRLIDTSPFRGLTPAERGRDGSTDASIIRGGRYF